MIKSKHYSSCLLNELNITCLQSTNKKISTIMWTLTHHTMHFLFTSRILVLYYVTKNKNNRKINENRSRKWRDKIRTEQAPGRGSAKHSAPVTRLMGRWWASGGGGLDGVDGIGGGDMGGGGVKPKSKVKNRKKQKKPFIYFFFFLAHCLLLQHFLLLIACFNLTK